MLSVSQQKRKSADGTIAVTDAISVHALSREKDPSEQPMTSTDQNAYGTARYSLKREAVLRLAIAHLRGARESRVIDRDPVGIAFHLARVAAARRLLR